MYHKHLLTFFTLLALSVSVFAQYPAGSPVALNGRLKVTGTNLTSECGNAVQLKGMSTHGLQWFEECLNNSSVDALVKDWKIDILRLAMYVQEDGYVTNPEKWKKYIDNWVDECARRGIYCMIDWHVLTPGNPNANLNEAIDFWEYMARKHGSKKHVLYEICNEPNGVSWDEVKRYANVIIPKIRDIDPNTVIMVGTPDYSSKPGDASGSKLDYPNLLYALHFYAASHGQSYRDQGNTAIKNGVGIFVTEFGTTDYTGDGSPSISGSEDWMRWMDENKISWCNWSFADKAEGSAALNPGVCKTGGWNSTTTSGTYIKGKIAPKNFRDCGTNKVPPVANLTSPVKTVYPEGSEITLEATASSTDGSITEVSFYANDSLLGTDNSSPYSLTWTPASAGSYFLKVVASGSNGTSGYSQGIHVSVREPLTPFHDTLTTVPGKIEAENYDKGGSGNAFSDSDDENSGKAYREDGVDIEPTTDEGGGYSIGYTNSGEWLKYSINVKTEGFYNIDIRVAATATGKKLHLELNDEDISGEVNVPNTGGWQTWETITVDEVFLEEGSHVLTLYFDSDGINVNYFESTLLRATGILSKVNNAATSADVYPNPSNTSFQVNLKKPVAEMTLLNTYGEVITTNLNVPAGQVYKFGNSLKGGSYLLKINYQDGGSELLKLIKISGN